MGEIVDLDLHGSLERILQRDYNSQKFVIACYLDNEHVGLATYISDDLNDMELSYIITAIENRRRTLFDE